MTQQQIISAPAPRGGDGERTVRLGSMPTGGRWGWYRDHEGNEFRRVSTLIKKVETDTYNLDQWRLRQVALGLARRDDLLLAVKAMGQEPVDDFQAAKDYKRKLNGITKEASEAAKTGRGGARAGTAVHDLTERVDRGEPIDDVVRGLPATAAQSLRAYAYLREANAWESVEIERTVVCEELEVAGTFDRVDLVPGLAALLGPGECQHGHEPGDHGEAVAYSGELPVVVDVKTEAQPWLNGLHIGPQLGIYSRGRKMWRPTGGTVKVRYSATGDEVDAPDGEYVPAPCVRQDVAIVVHVLDGQAVPYFVNLIEGWQAAVAAYEQLNRESRAGRKLGNAGAWFVAMPGVKFPRPAEILTQQAVAAQYADPNRPAPVPATPPVEQVAVRDDATGLVSWQPSPPASSTLDEIDSGAIAAIWETTSLEGLAAVWGVYTTSPVERVWAGPVAVAAEARRRQIECPQRALHTPTAIKCACGWMPPVPA